MDYKEANILALSLNKNAYTIEKELEIALSTLKELAKEFPDEALQLDSGDIQATVSLVEQITIVANRMENRIKIAGLENGQLKGTFTVVQGGKS